TLGMASSRRSVLSPTTSPRRLLSRRAARPRSTASTAVSRITSRFFLMRERMGPTFSGSPGVRRYAARLTRPKYRGVDAPVKRAPVQTATARRVKEIRRYLGPWPHKLLPREQVAEAIGVDLSTVKRWEAGSMPEPANLAKLAAFAGCDLEWLLTGHGRPPERGAMKRQRGAPASESPEAMRVQLVRDRLSSGSPDAPAHSGHPGNTPVMTAGERSGARDRWGKTRQIW